MSWLQKNKQKFKLSLEQQTKYWYRLVIIVVTLGLLDMVLTYLLLSRFGSQYEVNPLLRVAYQESVWLFIGIQVVVLGFVCGVCYYLLVHFLTVDREEKTGLENIRFQEKILLWVLNGGCLIGIGVVINNTLAFVLI